VVIFLLALGQVLRGGLTDPFKVIAYAGGFATGNYVGSLIEEKIAIGYLSLKIFPTEQTVQDFLNRFREAGFGVTCIPGQGLCGERPFLYVFLKRKDLSQALKLIDEIDAQAFYNISDTRQIHGGFFAGKRKGI